MPSRFQALSFSKLLLAWLVHNSSIKVLIASSAPTLNFMYLWPILTERIYLGHGLFPENHLTLQNVVDSFGIGKWNLT